jgi:hypothetical protein
MANDAQSDIKQSPGRPRLQRSAVSLAASRRCQDIGVSDGINWLNGARKNA